MRRVINLLDTSATLPLTAAVAGESPDIDIVAYNGKALQLRGYFWPVIFDLESTSVSPTVPLLFAHDSEIQVGHTSKIDVAVKSIRAKGKLSGANERADEIRASAANGMTWQTSVGMESLQVDFVDSQAKVRVNGSTFSGPVYIARKNTLREISILPLGADDTTSASLSASYYKGGSAVFEEYITKAGFDPATITEEQKTFLRAAYDKEQKDKVKKDEPPVLDDERIKTIVAGITTNLNSTYAAAQERIDSINSLAVEYNNPVMVVAGKKVSVASQAVKNNWSVDKTEVEMMKAARPNVGAVDGGQADDNKDWGRVASIAVMQASGLIDDKTLTNRFGDQLMQAAHKRYKGRIGLQQLLLEAARANGYTGSLNVKANLKEVLRYAFQASAFTTLEVPEIFTENVNTFLMEGYNSVDQTWRQISSIGSATDFKEITNLRVTGGFNFQAVAPDGHIPHADMDVQTFANQVKTYGRMVVITRTDIINDNLGAFTRIPRMLGRGGMLGLVRAFWTTFMDNSAFFVAGNNNVSSGALGIAGLSAAEAVFRALRDSEGEYINATPRNLLVPTNLMPTAEQLFVSTNLAGTASPLAPTANPHVGKYNPLTTPYLSDTAITGNSTTAYYLLADPNDVPVIETLFLNGQQNPTVETAEVDFSQLGVQMRGYWDWGVALQDPNGGVRSTGV